MCRDILGNIQNNQEKLQSNLWMQPPLLRDKFSKTPRVSTSNHSIWNLL